MAVRKAVWHWAWTLAGGVRGGSSLARFACLTGSTNCRLSARAQSGLHCWKTCNRVSKEAWQSLARQLYRGSHATHIAHRTSNVVKSSWNTFAIHKMKTGSVADRASRTTHTSPTHSRMCLSVSVLLLLQLLLLLLLLDCHKERTSSRLTSIVDVKPKRQREILFVPHYAGSFSLHSFLSHLSFLRPQQHLSLLLLPFSPGDVNLLTWAAKLLLLRIAGHLSPSHTPSHTHTLAYDKLCYVWDSAETWVLNGFRAVWNEADKRNPSSNSRAGATHKRKTTVNRYPVVAEGTWCSQQITV